MDTASSIKIKYLQDKCIAKKTPISNEIRIISNDIRQLIHSVDARITVDKPNIYLIDSPISVKGCSVISGFYNISGDAIYISDCYKVDSLMFYHNLLHETLHFVHHHNQLRDIIFVKKFNEAITEYLTLWLITSNLSLEAVMQCEGFKEELYNLFSLPYTTLALSAKDFILDLKIEIPEFFYRYAIADYDFFKNHLPGAFFKKNHLYQP